MSGMKGMNEDGIQSTILYYSYLYGQSIAIMCCQRHFYRVVNIEPFRMMIHLERPSDVYANRKKTKEQMQSSVSHLLSR